MNCSQARSDCKFMNDGRCEILRDTHFNRPCPFYKKGIRDIPLERYFNGRPERYREVLGTDGRYFIGEEGDVMSAKGKLIRKKLNAKGVPYVTLLVGQGRTTSRSVAVMVADAFLGGSGVVICKDGDPENCALWNLERRNDGKQKI